MMGPRIFPPKLSLPFIFAIALVVSAGCLLGVYMFLRRQPALPVAPSRNGIVQLRLVQTSGPPLAREVPPTGDAAPVQAVTKQAPVPADRVAGPPHAASATGAAGLPANPATGAAALPAPPAAGAFDSPSMETIRNFQHVLSAHMERYRRYPAAALGQHLRGTVLVLFAMRRDGLVRDVSVQSSSGSPILDLEAVDTVRRAQPLPQIPPTLADELKILLPVEFEVAP